MNSRFIQLFSLLFIYSITSKAQTQISGLILDSLTQKPIVGVSISDVKTGNGTVTNEEGQFQIFLDNMPGKLMISHVSYTKRILEITNRDFLKVNLPITTIQLPEFQTGNPAIAILNAVIRKSLSDTANKHYYKAFYQKVSYFNGKYTKFQQMFMNVSWSQLGVERWQPTNVRYAQLNDQRHDAANAIVVGFLNSSVIHKHSNFPLNTFNITDNYLFKIKHYLNTGTTDEIAVIECKPSKKNKNGIKFDGEITIQTNKDLLLKMSGKYIYPTTKGYHHSMEIEINFNENKNGFSAFNYVLINEKTTRPIQHYKNQDKIWLYFLQETSSFDYQKSQSAFVSRDRKIITNATYTSEYWNQNIPIKQTKIEEEIIKYFEKKGEFKSNF